MNDESVKYPVLKAASAGAAVVGGLTWGEIASMLAAAYTVLLIIDWWWKRFGKALFIRFGWTKGAPRDFMDTTASGDL